MSLLWNRKVRGNGKKILPTAGWKCISIIQDSVVGLINCFLFLIRNKSHHGYTIVFNKTSLLCEYFRSGF